MAASAAGTQQQTLTLQLIHSGRIWQPTDAVLVWHETSCGQRARKMILTCFGAVTAASSWQVLWMFMPESRQASLWHQVWQEWLLMNVF